MHSHFWMGLVTTALSVVPGESEGMYSRFRSDRYICAMFGERNTYGKADASRTCTTFSSQCIRSCARQD